MKIKFISPEMEDFVRRFVSSFLHWDLIVFFHHNPGTIDTAEQISLRLGRLEEDVVKAMNDLVEKNVLDMKPDNDNIQYFYNPSDEVKKLIDEFDSSVESRAFRLEVLSIILERELNA